MFNKLFKTAKAGLNVADDLLGDLDEKVFDAVMEVTDLREIFVAYRDLMKECDEAREDGIIDPQEAIKILEKFIELGAKIGL